MRFVIEHDEYITAGEGDGLLLVFEFQKRRSAND
jgi:hypothetical protein